MRSKSWVAVMAAVVLLVSGCSEDEPTPRVPSPTTATADPTPTETPSVDPLAIPEAARNLDKAGVEALVGHYFDRYNHLIETGDAGPIKKLYGDSCDVCAVMVSMVELSYLDGDTWSGRYRVRRLTVTRADKGLGVAEVRYRSSGLTQTRGEKVVAEIPGGEGTFLVFLQFNSGPWRITNIEIPDA